MAFSTEMAQLVGNQLLRFVTLNPHQLAGQVANLDFWLEQVRHALAVIDGYGVRFIQMHAAQQQYVAVHGTVEFALEADYPTERSVMPPRRIPDRELQTARRTLLDATGQFLERCRKVGFLSEAAWEEACASVGLEEPHSRRK